MNGKSFDKYVQECRSQNRETVNRMIEIGHEKVKTEEELKRLEHRKQRVENQMEYLSKKRFNNQKYRNHRLIHKGIAIESVDKNTELLTETEFYKLAEEIFINSRVKERVANMVAGRREAVDEAAGLFELAERKKG